jgi:ribosomal protein S18 acetylase RimI-like enzyme
MLAYPDQDPRKAGTIWAINLGDNMPVIQPECPAVFSRVMPESAAALAAAMGPGSLEEIHKRFSAGRHCYAARVGGEIASYGWVSFDEEMVGELDLRLRLLYGEAYIWDCATLPAYRQQHLYSALLSYILHELCTRQPVCRVWIGADLENIASQRGIARAGFHRIANLLVERFLAMRLVWAQGNPEVPDSWVAEARRVYLGSREQIWMEAVTQSHRV